MSLIPHYDPAEGTLLNFVNEATAEQYLSAGIAHAIRKKNGQIARLYRRVRERAYGTVRDGIAGLHAAASQTTKRVHSDSGALIREHKRADGWGWNEACQERCTTICNLHQDKYPQSGCICGQINTRFNAGDPEAIEDIAGRSAARWLAATASQSLRTFGGDHKWEVSTGMTNAVSGPVAAVPVRKGRMSVADARRATESEGLRRKAKLTPDEWARLTPEDRRAEAARATNA